MAHRTNAAAAEKQAELQDIIGNGYDSLKELVLDLGNGAEKSVHNLVSAGKKDIHSGMYLRQKIGNKRDRRSNRAVILQQRQQVWLAF